MRLELADSNPFEHMMTNYGVFSSSFQGENAKPEASSTSSKRWNRKSSTERRKVRHQDVPKI